MKVTTLDGLITSLQRLKRCWLLIIFICSCLYSSEGWNYQIFLFFLFDYVYAESVFLRCMTWLTLQYKIVGFGFNYFYCWELAVTVASNLFSCHVLKEIEKWGQTGEILVYTLSSSSMNKVNW